MSATSRQGATQREHVEAANNSPFRKNKEEKVKVKIEGFDEEPTLPESCVQPWTFFMHLHNARGSNGFGLNPISYQEMLAFFTLEQYLPDPWEIEAIRTFDGIAIKEMSSKSKNKNESTTPKKSSPSRKR